MAVSIHQLNLPEEVRELIKEYVFYSRTETEQRIRKRILWSHLIQCERWCFTDGSITTFYYKQLRTTIRFPYRSRLVSVHEYCILHAGFCNQCHNYFYANTAIPRSIECNCGPHMPDVD